MHVLTVRQEFLNLSQHKRRLFESLLALLFGVLFAAILFARASADDTVTYTGQGSTNGVPTTTQCTGDTATPGSILWIFTASGADSATITINGVTFNMTQSGNGTFKYVSGWYNLSTVTASAHYVGDVNGNTQLTVSHGCPPNTADVTLTKTFEQGVFTQASGGACFTLAPAAGTSSTTQCSNTPEWDKLPTGTYTVSESTTPSGYQTIADIHFTVATDCTGVSGICVATGGVSAISLGSFEDMLLPGHLQVIKQLGPNGTTWTGPNVTFYICAHNPLNDAVALTSTTCNASTAGVQTLTFNTNQTTPTVSGNLTEGYYTVCENVPSGYTVDHQCQEVTVEAGSVGSANSLTFVNTPRPLWCSPGFWATALSQNRTGVLSYLSAHTNPPLDLKTTFYSVVTGGAPLKKGDPTKVTLAQVLGSPSTYGGPAFNSVADYIASRLGWGGTQLTGENCPLNAQGIFTQP
jgi:hypothetical protein